MDSPMLREVRNALVDRGFDHERVTEAIESDPQYAWDVVSRMLDSLEESLQLRSTEA